MLINKGNELGRGVKVKHIHYYILNGLSGYHVPSLAVVYGNSDTSVLFKCYIYL